MGCGVASSVIMKKGRGVLGIKKGETLNYGHEKERDLDK